MRQAWPSAIGHDNTTYVGMVEQFDQRVGRPLAYLDDPNSDGDRSNTMSTHTLVIFWSDNGSARGDTSNWPLRGVKDMRFEGDIRVPLVMQMPGVVPHATNDTMITMVDFYKILAEMAGAALTNPATQPFEGESFLPVLLDPARSFLRQAIYRHFPRYLDDRAVRCSTIIQELGGKR